MKQEVAVIGVGQTTFTRNCGMSVRELCFEAYKEALLQYGKAGIIDFSQTDLCRDCPERLRRSQTSEE